MNFVFLNRQNRYNNRAMPNKDVRICVSCHMCLDDFSIPFNNILLFHEEMDATTQANGINDATAFSLLALHLDELTI